MVGSFADQAGKNPELEKPGLLQLSPEQPGADRHRPADVYIPSWEGGRPACFDLAVTSPMRRDIVGAASRKAGAAAEAYEGYKRSYLNTAADCVNQGLAFVPLVAEPSGGWGPSALCTFKALARTHAIVSGCDSGIVLKDFLSRLCAVVRKHNARAVLRRGAGASEALRRVGEARASASAALTAD